jgi:hypothetical protein
VNAAGVSLQLGEPPTWVVSVMHDITDTEHLERLRDQFFAAAAHSLKTPVAVIKADAQLLLPLQAPDCRPRTESIVRQCDRIDRLVQNLLVLSRARSRSLELYPSALELRPLIERISRSGLVATVTICAPRWPARPPSRRSGAAGPRHPQPAVRGEPPLARRLAPDAGGRPEGDPVAVGVRYHPLLARS